MDKDQYKIQEARALQLRETREKIMNLPAEKAVDAILEFPQPAALVQSFPEEDFYFLLHDIGVGDSIQLLSQASFKQWEYILDLEIWDRDRIEMPSVTRWLDLLLKASPDRFVYWFLNHRADLVEFCMYKNLETAILEHDQDPSELGEGFQTLDGVLYFRFAGALEKREKELSETFLMNFLRRLASFDHVVFQKSLLSYPGLIPAEAEEELYRLRNVRLAEKGFAPAEEAVGVYQPLKAEDIGKQGNKILAEDHDPFLPVPLYPSGMLDETNTFTRSLEMASTGGASEQIRTEFAGLCNLVAVADGQAIREKDDLAGIVKKVCGYLNAGLEKLAGEEGKPDINRTASFVKSYPLSEIFRVGYGLALELKWKAVKWRETSWYTEMKFPLSFWGEEGMGLLGGLFIEKPLFFDNFRTGSLYREFVSFEDMKFAEDALGEIMTFDSLLSQMEIPNGTLAGLKNKPEFPLTHKNLLLTLWAGHCLEIPDGPFPLELAEFRPFFEDIWDGGKIKSSRKSSFLSWLAKTSGREEAEIAVELGNALENMFDEIESEYANVAAGDLDPRFVGLFLLKSSKK